MLKNLKFVSILFILIITESCFEHKNQFEPQLFSIFDYSLGNKLTKQCSRPSPQNIELFFNISTRQQENLHQNFKKIYEIKPNEPDFENLRITNLNESIYQYIGVVIDNKKYIYINAFHKEIINKTNHDWKNIPLVGCDGGPSSWGILYNLKTKEFSELYMNGPL